MTKGWEMSTSPLVSVVIPTRNRASMLPAAIDSVLSQSMSDLELIVVDDQSVDETEAIVGRYADNRIRYFKLSSRKGGSAARNAGIRAARAAYIAFLDDDDEWLPEKLDRQLIALGDADAILTNVRFKSNGAVVH